MTHKAQGFTLDDYPNVKRWYAEVRARPQVQAGLAIGKFVKEPFDEEARRNMFGQSARRRWRGGSDASSPVIARSAATKRSSLESIERHDGLLRFALAMTRARSE